MGQETFQDLLAAPDEKSRMDCARGLLTAVAEKRLAVRDGIDVLLTAIGQEASSPPVRYMIWMLFLRGVAHEKIRELARRTLQDPGAAGRGKAAAYLVQFYPVDHAWLAKSFVNDPQEDVAFNAGRALLATDPDTAVRLWISCLDKTDSLPFWEVVSEYVIAHGSMEHREEIWRRDAAAGGASTWQQLSAGIFAAHQIDYLERPRGPIDYTLPAVPVICDNCHRHLAARAPRQGEKVRCLHCGQTFQLYVPPSMPR